MTLETGCPLGAASSTRTEAPVGQYEMTDPTDFIPQDTRPVIGEGETEEKESFWEKARRVLHPRVFGSFLLGIVAAIYTIVALLATILYGVTVGTAMTIYAEFKQIVPVANALKEESFQLKAKQWLAQAVEWLGLVAGSVIVCAGVTGFAWVVGWNPLASALFYILFGSSIAAIGNIVSGFLKTHVYNNVSDETKAKLDVIYDAVDKDKDKARAYGVTNAVTETAIKTGGAIWGAVIGGLKNVKPAKPATNAQ